MNLTDQTLDYWINTARQTAIDAHSGQFRRDNTTPYIKHPEAVANAVEKRLKPIAWLHDVIEDTNVSFNDLKKAGFPQYILDAVKLLTHDVADTNIVYWNKILQNKDATEVKIADIKQNMGDNPTEYQKHKYQQALKIFTDAGYNV